MLRSVESHTGGYRAAKLIIAALTSSFSLTTAVLADGMGGSLKDEPVAEEGYVWNGLYVAAGIGVGKLGHGSFDASKSVQKQKRYRKCLDDTLPSIASLDEFSYMPVYCELFDDWSSWENVYAPKYSPLSSGKFGDDSWEGFGTVQIGYDRLLNDRILVGAFTDFDFYPNADDSFSKGIYDGYFDVGSVSGHTSLNHIWNIGGRIGFLVRPRILLYAVGGYSRADLEGDLKVSLYNGPSVTLTLPDHMSGYFVGAGGELKLDKNVSLKFEYRFTDLGSAHVSGSPVDYGEPWGYGCPYCDTQYRNVTTLKARADLDEQIHSVRAALVIKLGEPERHEEPVALK